MACGAQHHSPTHQLAGPWRAGSRQLGANGIICTQIIQPMSAREGKSMSIPLFRPPPVGEGSSACIAEVCSWLDEQPSTPPTVALRARLRRPLPLGISRVLGVRRVALGPVPGIRGWIVRWQESRPTGNTEVGYLVTPSGRTFLLGRKNISMFSDRHGFPPQPNPVPEAHALRIAEELKALSEKSGRQRAAALGWPRRIELPLG